MKPKPRRRYSPEYVIDWILGKNFPQGAGKDEIFSLNILCIKATATYQMDMKTLLAVLMERVFFFFFYNSLFSLSPESLSYWDLMEEQ